ncbi:MAG: hypothetical protein QM758_06060 [Armatimonas sp.]
MNKSLWSLTAVALLVGAHALPARAAEYITTNRTVAGGNPLNDNHNGSSVFVGVNSAFTQFPTVQVDVVDPASFGYNDQTGGGILVYGDSTLNVLGGTFGVSGGTGAPGGGISLNGTSHGFVSGGDINYLYLNGAAPGAGGATATVTGGIISAGNRIISQVINGTLNVSGGTIFASSGQPGIAGGPGSVVNISGGQVRSASGSGIFLSDPSALLSVTGGTITGAGTSAQQRGIYLDSLAHPAAITGGTINGGITSSIFGNPTSVQASIGGSATVSNGVFAYGNAQVDVFGGNFGVEYASAASFLAMGDQTINFYGSNLVLSAPTPGSVFDTNNITGNFYTFLSGTFQDGQSAVGLRLFDATGVGAAGGFTLNGPTSAPEPSALALLLVPALLGTLRLCQRSPAR